MEQRQGEARMSAGQDDPFLLAPVADPPRPIPPYLLMRCAQQGITLRPLIDNSLERLGETPADAATIMDLMLAMQLYGRRDEALRYQACALQLSRLYIDPAEDADALRLLCLMAPGDLRVNMPIELLVPGRPVTLLKLYLMPGEPLPRHLPDHDLAIVAISEYGETAGTLGQLGDSLASWPRPVINDPRRIGRLGRDTMAEILADIPGALVPWTLRLPAAMLAAAPFAPTDFPLLVRPVGTHAGIGLARIADAGALARHLAVSAPGGEYYVAPFIDYRSADGQYRKYRLALIGGRPFLCHMAIADQWMLHYANAGMATDPAKRDEERRVMERFDADFAHRHRAALAEIDRRIGLDYVTIDCAETPDGALLFFEADNAGAVHDIDPPELYPYKPAHMARVFDAFHALLRERAGR
jgi:glutathione synthase/RimK-type ligase-like ATP-grasp enzyme